MGRAIAVIWIALGAACIEDRTVPCGDLRCPAGTTCLGPRLCAYPAQKAACDGRAEREHCDLAGFPDAACASGGCFAEICGDGIMIGREVCEDTNTVAGDGCSSDCRSNEQCGNALFDPLGVEHEQCDDGNFLAGDGCTSKCQLEVPGWYDISPQSPSARYSTALAYDEVSKRIVMFGGRTSLQTIQDIWEWDGTYWRVRSSSVIPSRRATHAMAYDSARHEIVMFGGAAGLTGTFTWDGISWTAEDPPTRPLPRADAAMAFDPIRGYVVLTGGSGIAVDTFLWDGITWTLAVAPPPLPQPPEPVKFSLAWDPSREMVIAVPANPTNTDVTKGWNGTAWMSLAPLPPNLATATISSKKGGVVMVATTTSAPYLHTFVWEGTAWAPLVSIPSTTDAKLVNIAMAFDAARNVVVLMGGAIETVPPSPLVPRDEIWEWNGVTWNQATPITLGGAPGSVAAAYRPLSGSAILFGGTGLDETWEWSGIWRRRFPVTVPEARTAHAMVALDDRVLMFGGVTGATARSDFWEWRDDNWHQLPSAPQARQGASMFYDRASDRVIVFGGYGGDLTVPTDDMFAWDGTQWTTLAVTPRPDPRAYATVAYDRLRDETVLFGGERSNFINLLGDTWIWDGTWEKRDVTGGPGPRTRVSATYHPLRKSVVMFGGHPSPIDQTWEWTGTTWQLLPVFATVLARRDHVTFFDAARSQFVGVGGMFGNAAQRDTFALTFGSASVRREACDDNDTDGDGMKGCADSDCWGRCTPMCPPDVPDCDVTAPHCGDGTCSVLEDRRLCPSDCP